MHTERVISRANVFVYVSLDLDTMHAFIFNTWEACFDQTYAIWLKGLVVISGIV